MNIIAIISLMLSALFISVFGVAHMRNNKQMCSVYTNGPETRINPKAPPNGSLCIAKNINAPHPKVLALINKKDKMEKVQKKRSIAIKYSIKDGKGMRNMLSPEESDFNCFFDSHLPPNILSKERSKFGCSIPEKAYSTLTRPILPEPYSSSEGIRLLYTPKEYLYSSAIRSSDAWKDISNMYATMAAAIDRLCVLKKNNKKFPGYEMIKCFAVGAMVYDAVRLDLINRIELSVSRHTRLLKILKKQKNALIDEQMISVHARAEAHSIQNSFRFFDRLHNLFINVPKAMNSASSEGKKRIVMKNIAKEDILKISETFHNCTAPGRCASDRAANKMFFFPDSVAHPSLEGYKQREMEEVLYHPLAVLSYSIDIMKQIRKRLIAVLNKKPVQLVLTDIKQNFVNMRPILEFLESAKALLQGYSYECIKYYDAYMDLRIKLSQERPDMCDMYTMEGFLYWMEERMRKHLQIQKQKACLCLKTACKKQYNMKNRAFSKDMC
ncbi:uncharacterized protein NEMAJ01_1979 [Nematocida major]|uniref:uncharacterized protein n=1 Tax=Nematocida major TaxID=1912982 RepID=UPI0020077286|nr:uncharacterized protein NEMAJ01_1979 [Nematocida major]KAH9387083.1 hypothetical protein NEMAJ01_1979 [Nematocida major]